LFSKDPECTFGSVCTLMIKCDCNKNYGSDDCSVDISNRPVFQLLESCVDSRKMDMDKIIGVGTKFSNNNTLYYSIRVIVGSVS
jgi:hypothetical protein